MKLFIVGKGRSGKDTVAEMIRAQIGLDFVSSSMFVAEKACRPFLEENYDVRYDTLEDCYADRFNHRVKWREAIEAYCGDDLQRMSREILQSYDIYVGIRRRSEFLESRYLADMSIWVDAGERVKESDESLDILKTDCSIIIDNNGTLGDLSWKVSQLCWTLRFGI